MAAQMYWPFLAAFSSGLQKLDLCLVSHIAYKLIMEMEYNLLKRTFQ